MSEGLTVLIGRIFGAESHNKTAKVVVDSIGKVISALGIDEENRFNLRFTDGTGVQFYDDGQSCCEHRYMRTDADLPYYVGAKVVDVSLRDVTSESGEWDEHEIQFLVITTDRGQIDIANHNEHNGYYGGFLIRAVEL